MSVVADRFYSLRWILRVSHASHFSNYLLSGFIVFSCKGDILAMTGLKEG